MDRNTHSIGVLLPPAGQAAQILQNLDRKPRHALHPSRTSRYLEEQSLASHVTLLCRRYSFTWCWVANRASQVRLALSQDLQACVPDAL